MHSTPPAPAPAAHQGRFAAALLDPQQPCPGGLRAWNGSDPGARLAVYRNNAISSLVDALADNCPVLQALVGPDFFRAMAALFVRQSPPRSPVLALYGDGLADFIAGFAPAAGLPYLADMARLEMARQRACHAADAQPLGRAAAMQALAGAEPPGRARLHWHPSLQLLRSRHAVLSLWAAHQFDDPADIDRALAAVDPSRAEDIAVLRHDGDGHSGHDSELLLLRLPPGGAAFVAASLQGADLDACVQAAQDDIADAGNADGSQPAGAAGDDPPFDLTALLAPLFAHGGLTRLSPPEGALS